MTTEFDPRVSIDQVFQLLASRLEPIIAEALAPHLGGLPWVALLEERDRVRGREVGTYVATDPQTQLKVLTERLGALGFPLDDQTRMVSVLGGELRIVRNRWAHHGELTAIDAWRTSDFVVRLLGRLSDAEGTAAAVQLREDAFAAVARAKGIAAHAAPASGSDVGAPIADETFGLAVPAAEFKLVPPPPPPPAPAPTLEFGETPQLNVQEPAAHSSDHFEPWPVVAVGDTDVIDELPKKAAKERVRAVAAEIVDYEGPIQLKRLAQLTAASFGVVRLHSKREKSISYQIQQVEGLTVDSDKFVWPTDIDPAAWRGFRMSDPEQNRDFLAVSPFEVANAIRAAKAESPEADDDEIERSVIRMFGKLRLTSAFRAHLSKAWQRV